MRVQRRRATLPHVPHGTLRRSIAALAGALVLTATAGVAVAEPMFVSKGFPRCTSCHFSPTGGGLLNDFGRRMSHTELPTFRIQGAAVDPVDGEQAFLWGALGDSIDPVRLGIALRPSHLHFRAPRQSSNVRMWMQADFQAAYRTGPVTLYGNVGRRVEGSTASVGSHEHWIAYQPRGGLAIRAGRFLPAYGVRFPDHTYFTRRNLGFDHDDEVYGVEVSHTTGRLLVQGSAAPVRAESLLDDEGTQAFTSTVRLQFDVTPRAVLVASGVFRGESDERARSGSGGIAVGISPAARWSIWTQVDRRSADGPGGGGSWVALNETAFEALPGLWVKLSPQYQSSGDPALGDVGRLMTGAAWIPRTHWNVNVSYYRDRNRLLDLSTSTLLLQLHLFP